MSKIKIIRSYPVTLKNDKVYEGHCFEHDLPFEGCICPKPYSTPESDGWYIEEINGKRIAYPTEDLYNELAMWINRRNDELVCSRCGKSILIGQLYSEAETSDLVEAFYEIHYSCEAI